MKKEKFEKILKEKDFEIQKLKIEINKLERRLLGYENAHTPSSKQRFPKKKEDKKSGRLGAKFGHPKYNRVEPTPNKIIEYTESNCPHCFSKLNKSVKTINKFEEEISKPQPLEITKHVIHLYDCPKCKRRIVPKNNAPRGCFGKNVQSHITLLKFEDRLPLRKVESSLCRHYGLSVTNTGIFGITKRVAKRLEEPYYNIFKKIRSAEIIYADETTYKLNGKTWWLWTFVCNKAILFVIRKSRGQEVIEEVLGKEFKGIIVSDGWKVYSNFAEILQRCWAHLLRECDLLEENHKDFKSLNKQIHNLFSEIKNIKENPPPDEVRINLQEDMREKLRLIAERMKFEARFAKLGVKILNGIEAWFTCVFYTDVEPTNNFAEQALRELIVQRKIMGQLRSEDGAMVLERVSTCLTTWKRQEKPLFQTLRSYL